MICTNSPNYFDLSATNEADNQSNRHTYRTGISTVPVVHTVMAQVTSKSTEQTETSLAEEGNKNLVQPRIIWKAVIQNPVRLTEDQAWPIARPGHFGLIAPERKIIRSMNKTVREYEHILPVLTDDTDGRPRAPSIVSRSSFAGKTTFTGRNRRANKFLKTIPVGMLQFPPLIRSKAFEKFLKCYTVAFKVESTEQYDTEYTEYGIVQNPSSETQPQPRTSVPLESIQSTIDSNLLDPSPVASQKPSDTSSGDNSQKHASIFKQSITHIRQNFPIHPGGNTVRRALAALKSLRAIRSKNIYSDMTDTAVVNVQDEQEDESAGQRKEVDRRPTTTSLKSLKGHNKRPVLSNLFSPLVVDLDSVYQGMDILNAKIKDHDLQLPIHQETASELRHLYEVTILRDPNLRDLLKSTRLDALPKTLRQLVRVGALYRQTGIPERGAGEQEAIEKQARFCSVKTVVADTAIGDVENLWIEAKIFTVALFQNWMAGMKPNEGLSKLTQKEMDTRFRRLGKMLRAHNTLPTSCARTELSSLISTCVAFPQYLPTLYHRITDWLESLLTCLFSRDRTTREEACYILAYVFTERNLVDGIRYYPMIDIGYDVTVTVLRAIEVAHSSFLHFFCLLALMIEGCPMLSILNAVMDIGPNSSSVLLNHMWPRLLYYALKYWHKNQFLRDRLLLKCLNDSLERAYVRGISRKHAKLAQIQLSRRFRVLTKPTTVWLEEWKQFKMN